MFQHFASVLVSPTVKLSGISPPRHCLKTSWGLARKEAEYALICPSASNTERNWLADRYAAIARHCFARGLGVVLTGSPAEREVALAKNIENLAAIPVQGWENQPKRTISFE